jgi:DNA-binding MltR family transcriptional regulator
MTDQDYISKYFDESNRPTDRSLVVLSVSLIDESLTELLKLHFKPSLAKTEEDALFGFSRSVSEIATKIELAYRLSIIDKKMLTILKKLARFRNIAAHKSEEFSLSKGKVSEQFRSLIDISPKEGANSSMPDLWLKVFTASFVGTAKSVVDNMKTSAVDSNFKNYGVIEIEHDRVIGRSFSEVKHIMNIWDKE